MSALRGIDTLHLLRQHAKKRFRGAVFNVLIGILYLRVIIFSGALMQDGVCQSCGRGMGRQPQQFENYGTQSSMGMQGNMSYIPNGSGVTPP